MLPILLYSLSDTDNNKLDEKLGLSSLRSFELLLHESSIQTDSDFFLNYTEEILAKMFAMSTYENNMEMRLLALKCIDNLAVHLPPNRIIRFQRLVCKALDNCLADKKRLCRQTAVKARNRWFLLSTKSNENEN